MTRALNILVVSDDNLRESVVYDVHLLAESLSANGHHVVLVGSARGARSRWRVQSSIMRRANPDSSATFYQFPYLRVPFLNWLFGLFTSYVLLHRIVRTEAIDVVLMYSVLFTGIPALMVAKSQRIPTAFRSIDMLHQLFRNPWKQRLVATLERYVYRRINLLLTLTEDYRRYLIDLGAPPHQVAVLPFPVNTAFFRDAGDLSEVRARFGVTHEDFVAVYMGHLYPFSALDAVVRAIPGLLASVPNFKLVVVGSGPLLAELEALRYDLKLVPNVILTGLQPFNLMPKLLGIADVCLNAYALSGTMTHLFSAKIVQYMSAGKPVLSLAQSGMMSSLDLEEHGIIFVDSVAVMMKSISNLAADSEKCRMLAEKNQRFASRHYDIDSITVALESELRTLCATRAV